MKKAKPILVLLLKLLVSVGLLGYLLARIHIERFLHTFATANFSYIALALLIYLVTQGVSAIRWTALARPLGVKTPFTDIVRYYFIGMFFNLFAPGTVGGDVSRVYYLVRDENARVKGRSVTTMHATMSVLMDRAIGMVVLVWLGAAGLLLFPNYAVPHSARVATFVLSVGLLVVVLITPLVRRLLPTDIHQLIVILLDNAIKYTKEGGEISLSCTQSHSSIYLKVNDTGIGIPEKDIPKIFDRFYQSDKARTEADGAGLGLSIAKWIIEKHHG
ncbi:MAG: flippase-like domain-containing protein, partial [Candidatus Binatia bacterium]